MQVLGNALLACPKAKRGAWKAFCEFLATGKPRGLGDRVEAGLKKIGITKKRAASVAKAVGLGGCGCSRNQKLLNEIFPDKSGV